MKCFSFGAIAIENMSVLLNTLKLLLPVLIPSWNFFDYIAPSPRVQFALSGEGGRSEFEWREFRPIPLRVGWLNIIKRMFWNKHWNESLFVVSCAERLLDNPTSHSETEIYRRIYSDLRRDNEIPLEGDKRYLRFRLVLVSRQGNELVSEVAYESGKVSLAELSVL